MYTRQVLGAAAVSLAVGYLSLVFGYTGVAVLSAVALTYLFARWSWAAYHRTRYWLGRGTRGVHAEECPNCNRSRYRLSGDWMLKCHTCGWTPGIPVLRWFRRSVPARQFRRSMSVAGAFIAGAAMATLLSAQPQTTASVPRAPTVALPFPSADQIMTAGAAVLLLVIAVLWALRPRQYYCRNCGQDLGRGDPPDACPKCGSNRFTHEDPGVGEKVRVEKID